MQEELKVKAVVDAYIHANKWQVIAAELAEALECMTKAAAENNCGLKIADEALQKYKQVMGG